jgi:hypothetical protein
MNNDKAVVIPLALVLASLSGCADMNETQRTTGTGAALGAVAGALFGWVTKGGSQFLRVAIVDLGDGGTGPGLDAEALETGFAVPPLAVFRLVSVVSDESSVAPLVDGADMAPVGQPFGADCRYQRSQGCPLCFCISSIMPSKSDRGFC